MRIDSPAKRVNIGNTVHPTGVTGTEMTVPDVFPLLGQKPKLANAYANALPIEAGDFCQRLG